MIISTDAADAACYEMRIARIFVSHEDAVTPKNRRGRTALRHDPVLHVDFRINTQATDDPGNRVPVHLNEPSLLTRHTGISR